MRDVDYADHYGITQYLEARNRCESLVVIPGEERVEALSLGSTGCDNYRLTKYSDCLDGGRRRGVMNIRGQRGITSNRVRAKGSHAVRHELRLCCVIQ